MDQPRGTVITAGAPAGGPPVVERVSRRGRVVRLALTVIVGGLLITGTIVGQDDAFPFGPFRMYATTDSLNAPVKSTRMEAVDTGGRRFALTGESVGLRRAEIEGQIDRFRQDPALLGAIGTAYRNRHPDGPELARIEIITRHFALKGGKPTGDYDDTVDVTWTPAGAPR